MRVFRFLLTLAAIAMIAPAVLLAGDQDIANAIHSRLQEAQRSGDLRGFSIDLEVEDGVVWMAGRVASSEQQRYALSVAQHTPGVTQVVNDLAIAQPGAMVAPAKKSDSNVITSVSSAISSAFFGNKSESSNVQQVQAQVPVAQPQQPAPYSPQVIGSGLPPRAPQQMAATVPSIPRMHTSNATPASNTPIGYSRQVNYNGQIIEGGVPGQPVPMYGPGSNLGVTPARYDHPYMPNYSWPSYAAYPNYAAVTYPKQYSPTAWPYIGPFYPYPQVPLGWRKVTLEWDDGWWMLDFQDRRHARR
jgi:hypothetical protein